MIEKKRIPEKSEIIDEMKEIKKALQCVEAMIKDNKYRPLNQESIKKINEYPKLECMQKAFMCVIADKIRNLLEKDKKINGEFKIIENGQCIEITNANRENLQAVKLDLSKQPPLLESTTYNKFAITREKGILGKIVNELSAKKLEIQKQLKLEEQNYVATTNMPYTQQIFSNTKIQLININQRLAKYTDRIDEIEELERIMYRFNFEDFNIIRKLLEEALGINVTEKGVKKLTVKQYENKAVDMGSYIVDEHEVNNSGEYIIGKNGLVSGENYIIGENEYSINYVKMIKKFY